MYSLFLEKDSKKIILSQGHLHCIYSKRSSRQKKKTKKQNKTKIVDYSKKEMLASISRRILFNLLFKSWKTNKWI